MGKIKSWLSRVFGKSRKGAAGSVTVDSNRAVSTVHVRAAGEGGGPGPKIVRLVRDIETEDGTFGTMHFEGKLLCHTLEDRWVNNTPRISCIPKGQYLCVPQSGPKFKNVWEITNVPGRSAILIHEGNLSDNTIGCVLCGTAVGKFGDRYGVVGSRDALNKLRATLPERFWLEIT